MTRTLVCSLSLLALLAAGGAQARIVSVPLDSGDVTIDTSTLGAEAIFAGGRTLALDGLPVAKDRRANLALVNLAPTANRCALAFTRPDGSSWAPTIALTLERGEDRPFVDAFAHFAEAFGAGEAEAAVSCEGSFYAFGLVSEPATSSVQVVAPREKVDHGALLALTKDLDLCAEGAICFDAPGLVHEPGPPPELAPVGRVTFPVPSMTVKRFLLSLDVTVADWYEPLPSGKNLIYWFVINNNKDMPGLLYFRGPGHDDAFARHGIHLTHPEKIKIMKHFEAQVGHTYHVVNDYDMVHKKYTITITDLTTGEPAVTLTGKPNVTSYNVKRNSNILVDMGFPPDGPEPTEVPSYHWKYANVHVEVYK